MPKYSPFLAATLLAVTLAGCGSNNDHGHPHEGGSDHPHGEEDGHAHDSEVPETQAIYEEDAGEAPSAPAPQAQPQADSHEDHHSHGDDAEHRH